MITKIKELTKQLIYYPKLVLDEVNYDDYWFKKRGTSLGLSGKWQRQRGDWIISQIEDYSTVLDIGCGDGGVLLYMKQKKNFHAVGADISDTCLNFLDSNLIHLPNLVLKITSWSSLQILTPTILSLLSNFIAIFPAELIEEKSSKLFFLILP